MASYLNRKDFLETLFHEYFNYYQGFIVVESLKRLDPRTSTRYYPNIDKLVSEQYAREQDVFFGVCPREGMGSGPKNVKYVTCLWAGVDLAPEGHTGREGYFTGPSQAAKAVRSFPLSPSIIVESGQGLHLYWLLKRMLPLTEPERVEALLANINRYFHCLKPVGLDSTLRLPGTVNCNHPGQFLDCKVKFINPRFRYELEDFEQLPFGAQESWDAPLAPPPPADLKDRIEDATIDEGEDAVEVLEEYATKEIPQLGGPDFDAVSPELLQESVSDDVLDRLADKIADRVVEKIHAGTLADRISERIASKLASHAISRSEK